MEKEDKTNEKLQETSEKREKVCPDCGTASVSVAGRCATCLTCGWSVCSI